MVIWFELNSCPFRHPHRSVKYLVSDGIVVEVFVGKEDGEVTSKIAMEGGILPFYVLLSKISLPRFTAGRLGYVRANYDLKIGIVERDEYPLGSFPHGVSRAELDGLEVAAP